MIKKLFILFTFIVTSLASAQADFPEGIYSGAGVVVDGQVKSNATNPVAPNDLTRKDYVDAKTSFIKSNEPLAGAKRKGDILYGILDQYTGEEISLNKISFTPSEIDGVIYFQLGAEYFLRNTNGVINPKWFGAKGDGVADDLIPIQKSLSTIAGARIDFPSGIYNVSSFTNLGSNIKITGVRGGTVIKLTSPNVQIFQVLYESNISIENITFQGYYPDVTLSGGIPMPADGIVDSYADAVNKNNISVGTGLGIQGGEKINVLNCEFRNFGAYGLLVGQSGRTFEYGIKISNCYFHDNYIGMELRDEAEYSSFTGNSFTRNQIGAYVTSGNNLFNSSHFDKNRVGVVLYNGYNDAHGTFSDCTFNHNALYGLITSGITNGEAFEGCQFWFGNIYLNNSRGINISGGIIGVSSVLVEGSNSGQNQIQGVCFHGANINENWNGSTSNIITKDNFNKDGSDATLLNNWNRKDNGSNIAASVFKLRGKTNTDKQALFNLNTTDNYFEIQAIELGVQNMNFIAQRQGGNMIVGTGTDNNNKFQVYGGASVSSAPVNPTDVFRKVDFDTSDANNIKQGGNNFGTTSMLIGGQGAGTVQIMQGFTPFMVTDATSTTLNRASTNISGNLVMSGPSTTSRIKRSDGTDYILDGVNSITSNTTLTGTSFGGNGEAIVYVNATSAAITLTLPTPSDMAGRTVRVIKTDSSVNSVTVKGNGTTNINGSNTYTLTSQYQNATVKTNNTQYYLFN